MPTYCAYCGAELDTAPQYDTETEGPCGNCGPEMIVIDLTERQAEIVDWLMGTPLMEHWFDPDYDAPEGCDFSHLPDPTFDGERFAVPADDKLIEDIRFRVTDQLPQNALDSGELGTTQAVIGLDRAAENLMKKIEAGRRDV